MSAIMDKHAELGGMGGLLGVETSLEASCGADGVGRFRDFKNGSIYWHVDTGAHEIHGLIRDRWRALGAEQGVLGYPASDEQVLSDGVGRASWFRGDNLRAGAIYWHPVTGTWELHGAIAPKYASLGGPRGPLGYPTSDEQIAPGGSARFNTFSHGAIYWTAATGRTREVHGLIYAKWRELGLWASALGYPVTDEYPAAIAPGRKSRFQNGAILWTPLTGAHVVP